MTDSSEKRPLANSQAGMEWGDVSSAFTGTVNRNGPIEKHNWELDNSASDGKMHYLVVVGRGKKKILKLFSELELCNCPFDRSLQDELKTRLLKILDFLRSTR